MSTSFTDVSEYFSAC